jgi:hypothetical protein
MRKKMKRNEKIQTWNWLVAETGGNKEMGRWKLGHEK